MKRQLLRTSLNSLRLGIAIAFSIFLLACDQGFPTESQQSQSDAGGEIDARLPSEVVANAIIDPDGLCATSGDKWAIQALSWYLEPNQLPHRSILSAAEIGAALAQWEGVTNGIRFFQTFSRASANLVFIENGSITFKNPACNNAPGSDFFGLTCFPLRSYVVDANWGPADQVRVYLASETIDFDEADLRSSLLHELGHAIGIAHSPTYFWSGIADAPLMNDCKVAWKLLYGCEIWFPQSLRQPDIDAARALYGDPTVHSLLSGPSGIFGMTRSGQTLAVTDYYGGRIYTISTVPGSSALSVSGLSYPAGIVNDGTFIYWTEVNAAAPTGPRWIRRMRLGGGQITTLATFGTLAAQLETDGKALYFWADGALKRMSKTGTGIVDLVPGGGIGADGVSFTIDAGTVYFQEGYQIKRVSTSGGVIRTMTNTLTASHDLVVAGGRLYWANPYFPSCGNCQLGIFSLPVTAVSSAPRTEVQGIAFDDLASDGSSLYARGTSGVVRYDIPGFNTVATLSPFGGNGFGLGLSLDARNVFWFAFGEVFMTAK